MPVIARNEAMTGTIRASSYRHPPLIEPSNYLIRQLSNFLITSCSLDPKPYTHQKQPTRARLLTNPNFLSLKTIRHRAGDCNIIPSSHTVIARNEAIS